MAIGTSDGFIFDDELQFHMVQPSMKVQDNTVKPIEPNSTPDIYNSLKATEKEFENNLDSVDWGPLENSIDRSPQPQNIGNFDPKDNTNAFNTPLTPQEQEIYKKNFGDSNMTYNYDMQGFIKANPNFDIKNVPEGQHYPDTYKKPSHPTFSNQSQYHGIITGDLPVKGQKPTEGGQWEKLDDGSYSFTPGRTNFKYHTPQELRDYFDKYEKGNTLILPNSQAAPEEARVTKTGELTPLSEEDKTRFNYDTGIVSSKDPTWQETGPAVRQEIEDMLNVPQEDHDASYNQLQQYSKQNPNFKPLGDALPAGRIKMRKDLPATQDFLEHLPDDVTAHEVNPNYILFIKKSPPPPLTSSLQIDRTDGDINFLMNDPVKVAQEGGSIADLGRNAYHRFLDMLGTHAASTPAQQDRAQELTNFLQENPDPNRPSERIPLEREGRNTYRREIRRSPADGTFRPAEQVHTDWEGFNRVLIRPEPSVVHIPHEDSHLDPRSDREILRDLEDSRLQQRLNSGREPGTVQFETSTGKKGSLDFIYDPGKKDIYIQWMGGERKGGLPAWAGKEAIKPHELGIDKTMKILKAVVEQYPEAETITAYRAGGARVNNPTGGGGANVTRQIPGRGKEATPEPAPVKEGTPTFRGPLMGGSATHMYNRLGAPGTQIDDL